MDKKKRSGLNLSPHVSNGIIVRLPKVSLKHLYSPFSPGEPYASTKLHQLEELAESPNTNF